ncbi:MAG: GH36 C-terminal domain-containing protein [Candidatus Limisoma sp.]
MTAHYVGRLHPNTLSAPSIFVHGYASSIVCDPSRRYVVYETNLRQTAKNDCGADAGLSPSQGCLPSKAECHGKIFTGDYLMKVGINILSAEEGKSHVFTLEEQK